MTNNYFLIFNTIILLSSITHFVLNIFQFYKDYYTSFYIGEVYIILIDVYAIVVFILAYFLYSKSLVKFHFILTSYIFYATGIMSGGYIFSVLIKESSYQTNYGLAITSLIHFIMTFIFTSILYLKEEEIVQKINAKREDQVNNENK